MESHIGLLHSSELMPGGSSYLPGEADVEQLCAVVDERFSRLNEEGREGVMLR